MSQVKAEQKTRLLSIDALRGFDMIWILGLEGIFAALFIATQLPIFETLDAQMKHATWHGFTAYDLIFPLFIFLSGVSIGIAGKALSAYPLAKQAELKSHAVKRLLLLVLLGIIYNHGWGTGIPADVDEVRFASVLGRIGLAWFVATLCVWYLSEKKQWLVAGGLLIGYWLIQEFVTLGGFGAGQYGQETAVNAWFDKYLLPGITYRNALIDPEGLLSNLGSIVNALFGVFIGRFLKANLTSPNVVMKGFVFSGLILLVAGYVWGQVLPINKSLWTSSFVLITTGYSILLLALFYLLIDVLKWQAWAKFFAVIGMNSIIAYLGMSLVNWQYTNLSLFGGVIAWFSESNQGVVSVLTLVLIQWLILNWLYQRKIFIKV